MKKILPLLMFLFVFLSCKKQSQQSTGQAGINQQSSQVDSIKIEILNLQDSTYYSFPIPQDSKTLATNINGWAKNYRTEFKSKIRKSSPKHNYVFYSICTNAILNIYINNTLQISDTLHTGNNNTILNY